MVKIEKELIISGIGDINDSEKIEKELNKIKGVEAYVNIASGRAIVIYKDRPYKWDQIQDKFKDNGLDFYECTRGFDAVDSLDATGSDAGCDGDYYNKAYESKKDQKNEIPDTEQFMPDILQSNTRLGLPALLFSKNLSELAIKITDIIAEKEISAHQLIYYAGSAACTSNSPFGIELVRLCEINSVSLNIPNSVDSSDERGITAEVHDSIVFVGSLEFMISKSVNIIGINDSGGDKCNIYIALDGFLLGAIVFKAE